MLAVSLSGMRMWSGSGWYGASTGASHQEKETGRAVVLVVVTVGPDVDCFGANNMKGLERSVANIQGQND